MFKEEVCKLGCLINEVKLGQLDKYYNLLIEWNSMINLTSITDEKDVYLKHFYDSLTVSKVIDLNDVSSVCDVGTGAGFPGVVLKIFYPHIKLTLIDSLGKRITFLKEVISELGLDEVQVLHARAEEYGKVNRCKFDLVLARAVSSFNVLLELSAPMMKMYKYFVSMRGLDDTLGAQAALNKLGLKIISKEKFKLPIENSDRTLILVQKIIETDDRYPRKFSDIKKRPL